MSRTDRHGMLDVDKTEAEAAVVAVVDSLVVDSLVVDLDPHAVGSAAVAAAATLVA